MRAGRAGPRFDATSYVDHRCLAVSMMPVTVLISREGKRVDAQRN
jgi:hypothetical protein